MSDIKHFADSSWFNELF